MDSKKGLMTSKQLELMLGRVSEPMRSAVRGHIAALEAENAALLEDSTLGLSFWHGNACAMAGSFYPSDPADCSDNVCREWAARIRAAHSGPGRVSGAHTQAPAVPSELDGIIPDADGKWCAPAPSESSAKRALCTPAELADVIRQVRGVMEGSDSASFEPSTVEAFATVRSSIELHEHDDVGQVTEALRALALLERRMGAVVQAARDTLDSCLDQEEHVGAMLRLRTALADAPDVFTQEEVEMAISPATVPSHPKVSKELKRIILGNLVALRKHRSA